MTATTKLKTLPLWNENYDKPRQHIKKQRHYFANIIFPAVIDRCESWTMKKAEHWKIDAFKLWCWRTCLRAPWTASRSNQSILKEINSEYSLEGLMLRLKFQNFGYLMWRANLLEKTDAGKDWGQEEKRATEDEMVWWYHQLNGHEFEKTPGGGERRKPAVLQSMESQKVRHDWLSDWTITTIMCSDGC